MLDRDELTTSQATWERSALRLEHLGVGDQLIRRRRRQTGTRCPTGSCPTGADEPAWWPAPAAVGVAASGMGPPTVRRRVPGAVGLGPRGILQTYVRVSEGGLAH